MLNLQDNSVANYNTNIYIPQDLEMSSIPYENHLLAEPNSWDVEVFIFYLSLRILRN